MISLKSVLILALLIATIPTCRAQTKALKVRIVYDNSDSSSAAVGPLLVEKIAGQPKFFTVVTGDQRDLVIIADCYRETANDPYSCFYTASKWLASNQAFLGGAIVVRKSAEEAATAMFASILQDIAERWNNTDRQMLIAELETCLALTESSCAVPEPLIAELKTKSINLSQYMRKGGLKL